MMIPVTFRSGSVVANYDVVYSGANAPSGTQV